MVEKSEIEAREAQCHNAVDYIVLAQEAAMGSANLDYVRNLLTKAEIQCQFPLDYVSTAESFAELLDDKEYAADLLSQAEDACFEGMEYAAVGNGFASILGDKEKGSELFKQGLEEVSDPAQILTLAGWAENGLGDRSMAAELYSKIEGDCHSLADYVKLVKGMVASGDQDSARALYQKAIRYCDDMETTVEYAQGALELFADKNWTRLILEEAEIDAQFPIQFVTLAKGFKDLLGDNAKVDALLEGGTEFAMSGGEFIDLATGYWSLKGDAEKSAAFYQQGLVDVNDRAELLRLAKIIGSELNNAALAKVFYGKAESRITGPGELVKLAEAIFLDTGDSEYASRIYARAEEELVGTHDLINLADRVLSNLEDIERAERIYTKALGQSDDFSAMSKLLDVVVMKLPNSSALIANVVVKMEASAETCLDLLTAHGKAVGVLNEPALGMRLLESAEERVTSLGELKKVVEAVKMHHADLADWNARLKEKVEKREANQVLYKTFQERENKCTNSRQFLSLGDAVMMTLDDIYYGRKLFARAEELLESGTFDLEQYQKLIDVVDHRLGDHDWVVKMIDTIAMRANHFSQLYRIVKIAAGISDHKLGQVLARKILVNLEKEGDLSSATNMIKLAQSVSELLGDSAWQANLLEKAALIAQDYLDFSAIGKAELAAGLTDRAAESFSQAVSSCNSAADLHKLTTRLRGYGVGVSALRALYDLSRSRLTSTQDKLKWTEGLSDLFGDSTAATKAYDILARELNQDALPALVASKRSRAKSGQEYLKPERSISWR